MAEQHISNTSSPNTSSTAELLSRLSDQAATLVRDEIALAKLELAAKARSAGIGAGLFSVAGVLGLFGAGTLIAAAVLGLAEALPGWLAALLVAIAIFAVAAVVLVIGKGKIAEATPAKPAEAIENVKLDLAQVKEARRS